MNVRVVLTVSQLSYASPDRLKRTTEMLNKVKSVVILFNQCLATCEQPNEALLDIVDFFDPITIILVDSISYLHECSSGWSSLKVSFGHG